MSKKFSIPFIILLWIAGCSRHQAGNPQDLAEIAGCWKGRQISKFDRPFSELVLFSLRSDGSLALSMIYEIGPRSRVWTFDTDVDVRGGTVRWNDQEGYLAADKNSMQVTRVDSGGESIWLYVRDRSADSLMMQLRASTSLWIDYFRKRTPAALKARLDEIIRGAEIVTCEPILFEMLRAVSRTDARKIEEFFATIPVLETPTTLWADAGRLGRKCAAAGFLTPAIYLLIAQICIHHDALLTSFDTNFKKILSVSPLRLKLLNR